MSEQKMLKATFFAALAVLFVNAVTMVANWRAYYSRVELFAQVAQLEQRVAALEQAGIKQDKQQ
jgi:hypothetical protein